MRMLLWLLGGGVGTALILWVLSIAVSAWLRKVMRRAVRDGIYQAITDDGWGYGDVQGALQSAVGKGIEDAEDRKKKRGIQRAQRALDREERR